MHAQHRTQTIWSAFSEPARLISVKRAGYWDVPIGIGGKGYFPIPYSGSPNSIKPSYLGKILDISPHGPYSSRAVMVFHISLSFDVCRRSWFVTCALFLSGSLTHFPGVSVSAFYKFWKLIQNQWLPPFFGSVAQFYQSSAHLVAALLRFQTTFHLFS